MSQSLRSERSIGIWVGAVVAIAFGLLTLKSGGSVLFADGPSRVAAGNYVPFVLWFNFIAGFFYIAAGVGLWLRRRWAVWLSISILGATLVAFVLLGVHIFEGGQYELRTIMAMSLRTAVWGILALYSYRSIGPRGV